MAKPSPYTRQIQIVEVKEEDASTLKQTYLPTMQIVEVLDETQEVFIEPDWMIASLVFAGPEWGGNNLTSLASDAEVWRTSLQLSNATGLNKSS